MRVAGESDNYGVEQEHLNGVFGAHLRITALRAEQGPGIELLEYLSPTDGRAYPADAKANDIVHWEIRLVSEDEEQSSAVNMGRAFAVARKATNNRTQKDPDGHVVVFRTAMKSTQAKQGGN
jgi:hypothetical protein